MPKSGPYASRVPDSRSWNVVAADRARRYPCERYAGPGGERFLRAVDVQADPATVFRWVCQLRVAPYSYDLVDNLGRRSPRSLTPGADRLEVGQRFVVVARIVEFEDGRHVTALSAPDGSRLLGPVAFTYEVRPGPSGARLVAAMCVGAHGRLQRAVRAALGWGDLVMMRKQLLTLKVLAERP